MAKAEPAAQPQFFKFKPFNRIFGNAAEHIAELGERDRF
jgi:hypothetical protein